MHLLSFLPFSPHRWLNKRRETFFGRLREKNRRFITCDGFLLAGKLPPRDQRMTAALRNSRLYFSPEHDFYTNHTLVVPFSSTAGFPAPTRFFFSNGGGKERYQIISA